MANIIITDIKELVDLKDLLSIDSLSNNRLIINENFHKLRRGVFAIIDALGIGGGDTTINNSALPPDIVANSFSTNLLGPPYFFRVDSQGHIVGADIVIDRSTQRRINLTTDPTTVPLAEGEIRWTGSDFVGWTGTSWISFTAGAAGGEVTDAVNVGTGTGIFYQKVLSGIATYEIEFKTLVAGTNVTITNTTPGEIVISSAGASGWSGYSGISGASTSGYSGFSGYSGISGYSGVSGATGQSGTSGFSGRSGYSGFSGLNGTASASGYSGYSGGSGYSGFSGYSGQSGYSGYSGDSGISGYSGRGLSGTSGYSGTAGAQGTSGYSGYSGYSGVSGASGTSGINGATGTSGYSGYSGQQGSVGLDGPAGADGTSGYSGTSGFSGNSVSGFSGYSGSGTAGVDGASGFSGYSGFSGSATNYTSLTYAALLGLLSGDLEPGTFYHVNNLTEPLVVIATSDSTLSSEAFSVTYPQDVIHWDYLNNVITYRLDTQKNLSAHYDWRTQTFTRWESSVGSAYYIMPTDPGNGEASLNGFYTFGNTFDTVTQTSTVAANGSGGLCRDIHIERSTDDLWGPGFDVNNIVFGNPCYSIFVDKEAVCGTIGDESYNINIGKKVYDFTIGSEGYDVNIGSDSAAVHIGYGCSTVLVCGSNVNVGDLAINMQLNVWNSTFGDNCIRISAQGTAITIGDDGANISIGIGGVVYSIDGVNIGNSCTDITIAPGSTVQGASNIVIGDDGSDIVIGFGSHVELGTDCTNITVGSLSTITAGNSVTGLIIGDDITIDAATSADNNCVAYKGFSTFKRVVDIDTALVTGTLTLPTAYRYYVGEIVLSPLSSSPASTTATIDSIVNLSDQGFNPIIRPDVGMYITWDNTPVATAAATELVTEGNKPITDGDNNDWIMFNRSTSGILYKIGGSNYI